MARSFLRAHGHTESRRPQFFTGVVVLGLAPAFAACVSYKPASIDLPRVLSALDARRWEASSTLDGAKTDGAGPEQLASFAVAHNPSLRALRNRIGVTQSLLVEAGLLSDPEIGWDGMDAIASRIAEGTTSAVDFLSGFGLSIPLPRPGELDAKQGAARWRVEEARRRVTQAEWILVREVYLGCEDLLEAERLLAQNRDLVHVAETTREYFERAKAAGAATTIQANLAFGDLLAIRARSIRLAARLREARHRLNALLGLPPSTTIHVVAAAVAEVATPGKQPVDPEMLVERSLQLRPDLAALLASYQASEEEVRLEVARQFPLVAIGTGIALVPGFLTRFNRPAIDTALARREALRGEIEAQVHEVRREIHDAYASLEESRRELRFLESELLPNAEESLRLAGEAFRAGEVTLLEILILQRALVDARTRTTEARAELQRRHWVLLAASGMLLTAGHGETGQDHDERTPDR